MFIVTHTNHSKENHIFQLVTVAMLPESADAFSHQSSLCYA